jgi:hypothetical protein
MTITLPGLLHADTATLRATADHWDQVVASIDATVEDLGGATRELPDHWSSGPGAQAAQDKSAELRVRIGNAHHRCHQISLAVRGYAEDLEHYRTMLHDVVAEAEGKGIRIDLAGGQLTAPVDLALGPDGVQAYARQISEILAKANESDQEASKIVRFHTLELRETPSADMRGLDEIALADFPRDTAGYRALWWDAQHPMNQERAINEHPELIGPAEGLPSSARDAANQVLLQREKESLLARREQLRAAQGAAGGHSPDQAHQEVYRQLGDVEARLGSVAHLQQRLADPAQPKVYLTGYQPGAEQQAVLTDGDPEWDRTDIALTGRWPH